MRFVLSPHLILVVTALRAYAISNRSVPLTAVILVFSLVPITISIVSCFINVPANEAQTTCPPLVPNSFDFRDRGTPACCLRNYQLRQRGCWTASISCRSVHIPLC